MTRQFLVSTLVNDVTTLDVDLAMGVSENGLGIPPKLSFLMGKNDN